MKGLKIRVGGFYVCESKGLVREVEQKPGEFNVKWRSYDLQSGEPTGEFSECSPSRIAQWADREATAQEIARMDRERALWLEASDLLEWQVEAAKSLPNWILIAEVRARALKVN